MYGIILDLDAMILEDEYYIQKRTALMKTERVLKENGYERFCSGVYICSEPKTGEMLIVYETIKALKKIDWFNASVINITAFKLDCWSDITKVFKEFAQ